MKTRSFFLATLLAILTGCGGGSPTESGNGVHRVRVPVTVNSEGLTVEQQNIRDRLLNDNKPGSIKHLYVISAFSGQAIIYSTVRGKVTSSGKRLTPSTVAAEDGSDVSSTHWGVPVQIGSATRYTAEVLQDDGTYGHSSEYLYWWDVQGRFHQHYISGGQIVHISDQPLAVKGIVINMEDGGKSEGKAEAP